MGFKFQKTATVWQFLLVFSSLVICSASYSCERFEADISFGVRSLTTELSEYATNGKLLVRESGVLPGSLATASIGCDKWVFGLEASSNAGNSDYAGQSSLGAPLQTTSNNSDSSVAGSVYWRVTEAFLIGSELTQRHTNREIVGIAGVAGYPEQYDRILARIGSRWSVPSALGHWTLAGSVSLYGDQSMRLTLPGKDALTLRFDEPQQWELSVSWRKALSNSVYLLASYRYINTEVGQSRYGVVTSGGNPVGIAYQPKSTIIDQPVSISLGMHF